MYTCPICNCLITDDECVMCGYKLKNNNSNQFNNKSVFDIFDFIDNKPNKKLSINEDNIDYNNTTIKNKAGTKYEKQEYIQIKYNKTANSKNIENKNNTQANTIKPNIIKQKNKKPLKINPIIYAILLFINPILAIVFFMMEVMIENVSKAKNKK